MGEGSAPPLAPVNYSLGPAPRSSTRAGLLTSTGFGAGFIRSLSFKVSSVANALARLATSLTFAFGVTCMINLCNVKASLYGCEYFGIGLNLGLLPVGVKSGAEHHGFTSM